MSDYGTRHTDLAVKRAEWRLSRVYRQAQRDIDEKLKGWQERHAAREEKYRQQVKAGKMTQADFDAWMRGQVFQEKQWLARRDQIDEILLNADREAQRIVNEGKLGVFVDNANYMGYKIEQDVNVSVGFTLYDQNTVARLIKSDPQILPKPAPGVQKDKAYTYYNKLVNSAITQGIVQGESVQKIAHRIAETTGESCYKSAMRNARTAYTGAQNAGRLESMRQMKALGINVMKQWVSAHDGHTRDAHLHLDGQVKEVEEPFDSDFNDGIMYPCDPNGAAANVYNCRCRLIEAFPEYQPAEYQPEVQSQTKFDHYTETVEDVLYRRARDERDAEQRAAFDADRRARRLRDEERQAAFAERNAHLERQQELEMEIRSKYGYEVTAEKAQKQGVEYLPLRKHNKPLTEEQIIARLAGGDMTTGSCASLSYCYVGQKAGYDVLDFRGGKSAELIARQCDPMLLSHTSGVDLIQGIGRSDITAGKRALRQAEIGTEYVFGCGRHAAIVRRTAKDSYEYLELQSHMQNGWKPFDTSSMDYILQHRFGARAAIRGGNDVTAELVSVDQMAQSDRALKILGFINTPEDKQMKGSAGHER